MTYRADTTAKTRGGDIIAVGGTRESILAHCEAQGFEFEAEEQYHDKLTIFVKEKGSQTSPKHPLADIPVIHDGKNLWADMPARHEARFPLQYQNRSGTFTRHLDKLKIPYEVHNPYESEGGVQYQHIVVDMGHNKADVWPSTDKVAVRPRKKANMTVNQLLWLMGKEMIE